MKQNQKEKAGVKKSKQWIPNAKQIKMVELLINPEDRRTKKDKCDEVGVTFKTLCEWVKNPEFVRYMNEQLDRFTDTELPEIWKAHIRECKRGNMEAIELYHTLKGNMPAKKISQEVTGKNGGPVEVINYNYLSDDELEKELEKYK